MENPGDTNQMRLPGEPAPGLPPISLGWDRRNHETHVTCHNVQDCMAALNHSIMTHRAPMNISSHKITKYVWGKIISLINILQPQYCRREYGYCKIGWRQTSDADSFKLSRPGSSYNSATGPGQCDTDGAIIIGQWSLEPRGGNVMMTSYIRGKQSGLLVHLW